MHVRKLFAGCLIACGCLASVAVAGRAFAQVVSPAAQVARITQPVDESTLVVLKGNTHPMAQARFDLGPAPQSMTTGRIFLVLRRSAAQDDALKSFLASLQDSTSTNYRHWLTPAQYGANFGVGDADLTTIQLWLQSHGFKVEKVPQGRNVIAFSGTVGGIQSAFHTSIHTFLINGEKHLANINDPAIPAALAPVVQGVAHLNDLHPRAQNQPAANGIYNASTKSIKPSFTLFSGTTPYLYTDPADAATIYDTPNATLNANYSGTTYDGTGVNIGIAGDSNLSLTDVTNYRVAFLGETAATANLPTVVVDGNDPGINGDEPESLLDNEIAGGLAPKAKIYFYISSDTDLQSGLFDAIFRAVDDNTVSILNISFGECEAGMGTAGNAVLLEVNEQAAAQGISVVVSTGDSGSAGCDSSGSPAAQYGLAVNALASTPYNIAAGGSDFDVLTNAFATYANATSSGVAPYYRTAVSYIPEEPWNDSTYPNTTLANNTPLDLQGSTNVVAGGGGASVVYAKPAFQTALTPTDSARDLPDIALLAGNGLYSASWVVCADSEYGPDCQTSNGEFIDGARFSGYGGTSAAAPAFSGMLALVEQKVGSRLGQANYVLYQLAKSKYATVFHDITTGDNSVYCTGGTSGCGNNNFMTGYDAGTGYDQASGLGSVDAAAMVANWSSVALSATTVSLSIDGSTAPVNVTHGTNLTFKVGVTPATATGVAGIVDTANEVSGGAQNNGQLPITLASGTGSTVYNGLPGGTYTVYARYGGDTTDAASTSTPVINVTINPEASTTALQVSSYNPLTGNTTAGGLGAVPYGSQVFFDAAIYGTAEGPSGTTGIATGTVTFADGSTTLGQNAVSSSNTASYPALTANFPAYALGAHSLTAKYTGDPSYDASTSAPVNMTVVQNTSSVSASASTTTIPSSGVSTLTITVSAPSLGLGPTGTVVLTANGKTLATLTGLVAQINDIPAQSSVKYNVQGSQLVAGSNTITMTYSGDTNYIGSTGTVALSVTPSKFTLTNNGPITIAAGATTGDTATVSAAPTNSFVGVINFTCAVTTAPASAVSPATCAFPATLDITGSSAVTGAMTVATTATTTPGSYAITVTGTDAATGQITASTVVNVTVTVAPSIAIANSGNLTLAAGATTGNTSTITVTPAGGFTGTVGLTCAVTTTVVTPNDPPTCSLPASVSVTGPTAVTATLSVSTTATTTAAIQYPLRKLYGPAGGILAAFALFFGVPRRRRRWTYLAVLLSVLGFTALGGCGGSSAPKTIPGTTAGTYVVTITAASTGVASQTTTVSVTVE